jgi:FkbM family methyltransferase
VQPLHDRERKQVSGNLLTDPKTGASYRPPTYDLRYLRDPPAKWAGLLDLTRPGDQVLDLGACVGGFALVATQRGCVVTAYEPDPENFWVLESNGQGKWTSIQRAAADRDGWGKLYAPPRRLDTGIRTLVESTYAVHRQLGTPVKCEALQDIAGGREPRVVKADLCGLEYSLGWSVLPRSVEVLGVAAYSLVLDRRWRDRDRAALWEQLRMLGFDLRGDVEHVSGNVTVATFTRSGTNAQHPHFNYVGANVAPDERFTIHPTSNVPERAIDNLNAKQLRFTRLQVIELDAPTTPVDDVRLLEINVEAAEQAVNLPVQVATATREPSPWEEALNELRSGWVAPAGVSARPDGPTALGVYIFAGGFALGVAQHFNILEHWEDDPKAWTATFQENFPNVPVRTRLRWPFDAMRGLVDLVYANPPCAPWSAAGGTLVHGRDNWLTDPRVECVHNTFKVLERVRPKVWAWESVARTYTLGRPLVDELSRRAMDMGYSVTHWLTDGVLHGIPQRRRRFMLVAHNVELDFDQPAMKLVKPSEVIGDQPQVPEGEGAPWPLYEEWVHLLGEVGEGRGLREAWNEVFGPDVSHHRPPFLVHRTTWDVPVGTLLSMSTHIHPKWARGLSTREVSRLCGYPDDYRWVGNPRTWQAQMTQAVMPAVAEYFARNVRRAVDAGVRVTEPRLRVVDQRPMAKELGLDQRRKRYTKKEKTSA